MTLHYDPIFSAASARKIEIPNYSGRGPSAAAPKSGPYRAVFKRVLDIVLILFGLPFVLPIMFLLAILVAAQGGRPFYTQQRVGLGGRHYRIWKLRTMVPDADARLAAHLERDEAARAEWTSTQKLKSDPRITRFGGILRRTSLDELPQLWNVLRGDMSLVGPRPMMPCQQSLYAGQSYYRLRPGITGAWQVSERNRTTFADRANFDQAYEGALSLRTDAAILLATVAVVMRGTGY